MLEILYQDEHLVAINKPRGLLVHRTKIAQDVKENAILLLREQLGQPVFPVHRLDRKTTGVLLFALSKEVLKQLNEAFASRAVRKSYLVVVRGYTPDALAIDYAVKNDREQVQDALTTFNTLQRTEIALPFGKHLTSRYSLIVAQPETGRQHQLRKHFKHIFHPILGSRPHGCNKQNKLWLEQYALMGMLLHAHKLEFQHPVTQESIEITAAVDAEFLKYNQVLGFDLSAFK